MIISRRNLVLFAFFLLAPLFAAFFFKENPYPPTAHAAPAQTLTATPFPQATPSPTSSLTLTSPHPTDREILEYIWAVNKIHQEPHYLERKENITLTRQEEDVTGDGQKEIVVNGFHHTETMFLAILAYLPMDAASKQRAWQQIGYFEDYGHYCADARVTIQKTHIVFDAYGCSGGTGGRNGTWTQHWVKCGHNKCAKIWNGEILFFQRGYDWKTSFESRVSQVEQISPDQIVRTTHRFGLGEIPWAGFDYPATSYRSAGPDTREIYKWNGASYDLVSQEQLASGIEITREFDQASRDALDFLAERMFVFNSRGTQSASEFWGIEDLPAPERSNWKPENANYLTPAAALTQEPERLIAAILGNKFNNMCRLVVQRLGDERFELIDRVNLSCVPTFTRLYWLDIDDDEHQELLMLSYANEREDEAGTQRLRIFRVGDKLQEVANVVGDVNGADGVGVRWVKDEKGFVVYTGDTPHFIGNRAKDDCVTLNCLFTDRRWNTYLWDAKTEQLVKEKTPR